jgi:hypothetical protein
MALAEALKPTSVYSMLTMSTVTPANAWTARGRTDDRHQIRRAWPTKLATSKLSQLSPVQKRTLQLRRGIPEFVRIQGKEVCAGNWDEYMGGG